MEKTRKEMHSVLFILFYLSLGAVEIIIFGPRAAALSAERGEYLFNPILYSLFNVIVISYLLYCKEVKSILQDFCKSECRTKLRRFVYVGVSIFMCYLTVRLLMLSAYDIGGFAIINLGFIKISIFLIVSLFGLRKKV